MCSHSGSMKLTGTLWDIIRAREQENARKQKDIEKNKLSQYKRENEVNNNPGPPAKKSTPEYWKTSGEDTITVEAHNIWNLPFKPIVLEPAKEINACFEKNKIPYKLRPHNIDTIMDYSSVKSQYGVKDPRLYKDIKRHGTMKN